MVIRYKRLQLPLDMRLNFKVARSKYIFTRKGIYTYMYIIDNGVINKAGGEIRR